MEQVPTYAIIGNGRMARHTSRYFKGLGISFSQWARETHSEEDLIAIVSEASHILLLISDKAIEAFIETHPFLKSKKLIHFSGSLVTSLAFGTHPLMTFSSELYTLEVYKNIPFVCDQDATPFPELFPKLPNPSYTLPVEVKSRYHALCVMSNNFTTLLWQKFYKELDQTFHMPSSVIHPYLDQTLQNLKNSPCCALTGPLTRKDQSTIDANLKALENDPFQNIYKAFLETYNTIL